MLSTVRVGKLHKYFYNSDMYFYRKMLCGKSIKNPALVRYRLRRGIGQPFVYVLLINTGEEVQFPVEIVHSAFLQQPYYRENRPYILGIAHGKKEAVEMLRVLVDDTYRKTGGFDILHHLFPGGIRRRERR